MSVFASAGQKSKHKIERVKGVLEHLSLYVGLAIYTALGAKIFQLIEETAEMDRMSRQKTLLIMERRTFLDNLANISYHDQLSQQNVEIFLKNYERAAHKAATAGVDLVSGNYQVNWDYLQSVFFSTTILTTIGYGNIFPATFSGRVFCLFFALVGIPFTLSVIADVGGIFANLVSKFWKLHGPTVRRIVGKLSKKSNISEEDEEDEEEDVDLFNNNFLTAFLSLLFLFIFLSFGAGLFTLYEDWSFLDAFYFCFITMTTIGFGDLVPDLVGDKTVYMLFCTVYIFIGMAFTTTIIECVRRQYAESWRKMVELRAQIQAQLKLAETLKKLAEHAENHNIEVDLDLAGDLAQLKKNLAKLRKGKHGKGLGDILIEEIDWIQNDRKVKAVTIVVYETSL